MRFNMQSLPADDNINRFAYSTEVRGDTIVRKGKMVAAYGNLRFESVGTGGGMLGNAFNAKAHLHDFMMVTGQGKLVLGDNGNDIASFNVEDATFTLKVEHVLGFATTLKCQESTVAGYVTLIGSGRLLASSNGPVIFLEPPARVDPEAVLGWADMPSPSYRYDLAYIRGFMDRVGAAVGVSSSGEERQLDFVGKGTILVQSSEAALGGRSSVDSLLAQASGMHQQEIMQLTAGLSALLGGRR
jgi:uncharacterized protein (AIM24 family)